MSISLKGGATVSPAEVVVGEKYLSQVRRMVPLRQWHCQVQLMNNNSQQQIMVNTELDITVNFLHLPLCNTTIRWSHIIEVDDEDKIHRKYRAGLHIALLPLIRVFYPQSLLEMFLFEYISTYTH